MRLTRAEEIDRGGIRPYLLKQLHDDQYLAFATAEGFGFVRMIRPHRGFLLIREQEPEKLPDRPNQIDPRTAIQSPMLATTAEPDHAGIVAHLHEHGTKSFLNHERMGFVKSRQIAAGFNSHAMTQNPANELRHSLTEWQMSRLELVSLLKFDSPRVYLSEHLPRMEELRNAKTRPVDEFEQRGLEQLRDGEDIVTDQQLNTIRMVGAVRAAKQCLDCHSVRRGDLLGAFSYLLDRKQPIPPPKVEGKPVSMIRKPPQDT